MTTRAEIIAEARTWLKTPWHHQHRLKGYACDCAGVAIMVPVALGIFPPDFDVNRYQRTADSLQMRRYCDELLDPVLPSTQKKGGDVLLLAPKRIEIPQHLAILTFNNSIIHAIDKKRGVREHRLDERWARAIVRVYRYPGVED